jgi:RNA polymerase sigma factor (sigma-70 family)
MFLGSVPGSFTDDDPYAVRVPAIVRKKFETLRLTYYGKDKSPPTPAPLTREKEAAAFLRYRKRKTKRDRELLIRQYLCWSFDMAARYKGPRLGFDEAISVANCGLMEALNDYKPEKGFRFTTYAAWVVRRHLIEAIVSTYPVHVSDHIRKKWRTAETAEAQARRMMEEGDEPKTLKEFFERLGETSDVDIALLHERPEDAPFVPSGAASPVDALEKSSLPEDVRTAIKTLLTPLEQQALIARHYTEPPESYEATGRRLHVSKNRIRESYDTAIVRLRRFFQKEV